MGARRGWGLVDEEDHIPFLQVAAIIGHAHRRYIGEQRFTGACFGGGQPHKGQEQIPFCAYFRIRTCLKNLWQLSFTRCALHRTALGHDDLLWLILIIGCDCQRQIDAGRNARTPVVAQCASQRKHRSALGCGANVAFIRNPFLIKAQHIGDNSPGVQQGNRPIVVGIAVEASQRILGR